MPVTGSQIQIKWCLALCHHAGFPAKHLATAVAVMWAESGRYPMAWNENTRTLPDGSLEVVSTDRGLFQINDRAHPNLSDEEAYNPLDNVSYAAGLSRNGANWSPWVAHDSGAYLKFVPPVLAVQALRTWRSRVPFVELKFGDFGGWPEHIER